MKKEETRKEYFKLRIKGHTNNQCRKILKAKYNFDINIRTLRRWTERLSKLNKMTDKTTRMYGLQYVSEFEGITTNRLVELMSLEAERFDRQCDLIRNEKHPYQQYSF